MCVTCPIWHNKIFHQCDRKQKIFWYDNELARVKLERLCVSNIIKVFSSLEYENKWWKTPCSHQYTVERYYGYARVSQMQASEMFSHGWFPPHLLSQREANGSSRESHCVTTPARWWWAVLQWILTLISRPMICLEYRSWVLGSVEKY